MGMKLDLQFCLLNKADIMVITIHNGQACSAWPTVVQSDHLCHLGEATVSRGQYITNLIKLVPMYQ